MRITIKVKHLILSTVAVIVGAYMLMGAVQNDGPGADYYEQIRSTIIEHGNEYGYRQYDVYTGPGFGTVNSTEQRNDPYTWEEKERLLLDYLENGPVDGYLRRAALQLAGYYMSRDQQEQAFAVLDQAAERFHGERNEWQRAELSDWKAKWAEETKQETAGGARITGTVRYADGTPVPGAGVFLRHESIANRSVITEDPYQAATDRRGHFVIEGVVPGSYQLFLGFSFEQIDGYTWPAQRDSWIDIEGEEELRQDIVLHPLMELVSPVNDAVIRGPEVEFVWKEVEGAAYYNVNVGVQLKDGNGSVSSVLQSHVKGNRCRVTLEQLYNKRMGISYAEVDGGGMVPDPYTILAFANPDNRFFWNVEAYDQEGNMITRSNGYRLSDKSIGDLPFFRLKERELTDADRLLLDGKLKAALEAYRLAAQRDPSDVHSLRMIVWLSPIEANAEGDSEAGSEEDAGRMIKVDVLPYLKRLVELDPAKDFVLELGYEYYQRQEWSAYFELYDAYAAYWAGNDFVLSMHATALLRTGQIEEARAMFEHALGMDSSHRFAGYYVALPLYEDGDFDEALDIARRYPERGFGGSGKDWAGMVVRMQEEAGRTADQSVESSDLSGDQSVDQFAGQSAEESAELSVEQFAGQSEGQPFAGDSEGQSERQRFARQSEGRTTEQFVSQAGYHALLKRGLELVFAADKERLDQMPANADYPAMGAFLRAVMDVR